MRGSMTRLVHTYSIVARHPDTGELGVAVQSHYFGVGAVVPWAEAGVGAIATQARGEPAYGPRGLELMRTGVPAPAALRALLEADQGRELRQVAMIDARGEGAAHTGGACIPWAGHEVGAQFSVQANMMLRDTVCGAMRDAYTAARGLLAERLLAALDAAQAEGGDIRGRQSAALLVVAGQPSGQPWNDRLVDLRVEDHPEPLVELRRLLTLRRAYDSMGAANEAALNGDLGAATQLMTDAQRLAPDKVEITFWYAISLAAHGRMDECAALLEPVIAHDPNWRELIRRLPDANLVTPDLAESILSRVGQRQ